MKSRARDLCDQFGYPGELAGILEGIVEIALEHLGDVRSIVLSPSVSTGDFLWTQCDSGQQLLSDIDGFIYVDGGVADSSAYAAAIERLSAGMGGPMFHIDLALNSTRVLGHLPETYQFVETGLAGFVLYGEPVLNRFPKKFDPRASRQAFLMNLFKPLQQAFLLEDRSGIAQAAARLILDIPILAASEQRRCIAGHRARARWFLDERPAPLGQDQKICAAVEAAHDARESPPGSLATLEPLLHAAIPRVVRLVDGRGEFSSDPDRALTKRLSSWLPPRAPRRLIGESRALRRRPTAPLADLRWLIHRKEAAAGAALLGLFAYLAAGADGRPPSGIRARLHEFARQDCSDDEGLAFVRSACEVYSEGLFELYPSLRDGN